MHTVPEEELCVVSNVDSVYVCVGHIGQWADLLALGFSLDTVASKPLAAGIYKSFFKRKHKYITKK